MYTISTCLIFDMNERGIILLIRRDSDSGGFLAMLLDTGIVDGPMLFCFLDFTAIDDGPGLRCCLNFIAKLGEVWISKNLMVR